MPLKRLVLLGVGLMALASACTSAASPTPTPAPSPTPTPALDADGTLIPTPTPTLTAKPPDITQVPPLDTSKSIVPLGDVVFDTFQGGFVPLDEADDDLILRLRDAIRPIYQPTYDSASQAQGWLRDGDLVIGFTATTQAYAYPVKTLTFREIVNETIDGVPLAITYCPLCGSAVVYDRRLGDKTLLFGNTSALFESDMVMYDHQTGSYWHQTAGEALVGPLAGQALEPVASAMMTFGEWRALYPDSLVLSNSKENAARSTDPMDRIGASADRGDFFFPVERGLEDTRLSLGTQTLVLRVGGQWRAYPLGEESAAAANDTVGGLPVVVFSRGLTASAYFAEAEGLRLTFTPLSRGSEPQEYQDEETGSTWDLAGRAVDGLLAGATLNAIPSRRGFWFSVSGVNPAIELYQPPG